ncbi:MAG: GNAT family N-acetyltransferase [Candidatus Binataceae bacterium]
MDRVELVAPSGSNFRLLRQRIWSSDLYKWARRMAAELTRPFRRLELCIIYSKDLTKPIAPFDAGVDVAITLASAADQDEAAMLRLPPNPSRRELFKWRREHDCVCFIARAGSKLVAYSWIRLRPGPEEGEMIALSEHEMYSFDLYVDDNWRGNRIYTALGTRSRIFCQERGCTAGYARVSVTNRKSQKAIRRGGWHATGLALRVRRSHGGWPILGIWGAAHPLARLRRGTDQGYPHEANA